MANLARSVVLAAVAASFAAAPVQAQPAVVGTIPFPGGQPLSVAVYEAGDTVLVTEDNSGKLFFADGLTNQVMGSVGVGAAAFAVGVNQAAGKAYVGSSNQGFTTGIGTGTGLVSVVDLKTRQLLGTIDPGPAGFTRNFHTLASDEARGKVYVTFSGGAGVIDVATDQYTKIPAGNPNPNLPDYLVDDVAVNAVTGDAYLIQYGLNRLLVFNPGTPGVQTIDPVRPARVVPSTSRSTRVRTSST